MPSTSGPDALLSECRELQAELRRHPTLASLHGDAGWPELAARLSRLLGTVRRHAPASPSLSAAGLPCEPPRPAAPLRAVHWNIEKALRFDRIREALLTRPELRGADLVLLNEVDLGMARSGNRDVAAELSDALGLHAAWAPMFLETTAGRAEDRALAAGTGNREGLLGLAVLARWPLGQARVVELPSPQRHQFEAERMYGRHVALAVEVLRPGAPLVAVSTHLEVHRGRAERARQARALLDAVRAEARPVVLAGDFNSHTFDRGRAFEPLRAGLALLLAPEASLRGRFLHPDRGAHRETLFDELRAAGFAWATFTDRAPTLRLRFERVGEARALTRLAGPLLARARARMERRAALRLDWFAARGFPRGAGRTAAGLDGPEGASDHAPIAAEFLE